MDAPKYQKSDPAILLLNEIDILLAQTRLMELYLKQAQATAANQNARLQEQYESELATLRAALTAKERQLQERPVVAVDHNLQASIEQLQRELSEKQRFLAGHEAALERSANDINALQSRIAQLEAENNASVNAAREANALRESLAADVAALNQELENSRRDLHQQQQAAREIESGLREQLQRLQNQVAENQANAFGTADELHKAQQEIAALRQHLGSLQALQDDLQSNAARELEQARGRFEGELASLRRALAERDRTVVESQAALVEIERGLRSEISALRHELEQKQAALAIRDDELRAAGAQIAALQRRVTDLELAHREATAATAEIDRIRRSLAEEVANLQHEVEVKEKELTHRYEAVTAVELALHGRIQALQQELARAHEASNTHEVELQNNRAEIDALQSRIVELERAQADISLLDATRQQLEGDLNRLRADLAQKESFLAARERAIGAIESSLGAEIAALRQALEQERSAAASASDELRQARAELAASRENFAAQLAQKDHELGELRASATRATEQLSHRVDEMARQLSERERNAADLEARMSAEIEALHQQLARERSATNQAHEELLQRQAELAAAREALDAQLKLKDDEIASLRASAASQTEQLSLQVDQLRFQVAEHERGFADLEARRGAEIATLQQQLAHERSAAASASDEVRQAHAELAESRDALEAQLRQKDEEIEGWRASGAGQTEQLTNRINELQLQLTEKQLLADSRGSELEHLRITVNQLSEQLSASDDHLAQARVLWQTTEAQLNSDIARLSDARDDLSRAQTALAVQLDQARGANAGLRSELQEAKNRTAELEALLHSSQAAMAEVESDRARLSSSLEETIGLYDKTKSDAVRELAEVRKALETEIAALRGELQQKAWSLAQQQASVENLAQVHREQIRKLEARLAEQQPATEKQTRDLEEALSRANSWQQQVEELQAELQRTQAEGASQAEQIRQDYAARLDSANALLAAKSAELAKSGAVRANVEESLRAEITRLHNEMQSRTAALQTREDELDRVRAEMTAVQNRIVQLESVTARTENEAREIHQAKSALEGDLSALRDELQQKSSAVTQQQAAMDELAARHRGQIEQLEANLSEHQRASDERRREIDQSQAQIALLQGRVEELQAALQQVELSAASQTEQLRQEYQARVDALSRELAENAAQFDDRAGRTADMAHALRSEIARLIGEAQERNLILQNRNDELVRVKGELDSLSERFTQLESHAIQAESSANGEAERVRTEYQAQLALLQAELSQKEWALEERQAIVAGLDQEHRLQIEALRQQLAEKERMAAPSDGAFVMGDPNLTDAQREKLHKLDDIAKAIRAGDDVGQPAPSGRRWQTGFGWKRRWRS